MQQKRRFFLNHKKSSALAVSVAIHGIFIAVALTFVAISVVKKDEVDFEAKEIKRPQMKLRKLQVPVKQQKKTQAPKLRHTIVTKPKYKDVVIKMPEVVGVPGGSGYGRGEGLGGLGFGFDLDLFGSDKSSGTGNEFIGIFYDLKQTERGELTEIGRLAKEDSFASRPQDLYRDAVKGFINSGCRAKELEDYFAAPRRKFATAFNMPPMGANEAPRSFGVEDQVEPSYWLCVYRGQIAAPVTGKYRFLGLADDVLVVRVKGRVVLDACWPEHAGRMTSWQSRDEDNRKYQINQTDYGSIAGAAWDDIFPVLSQGMKAGRGFYGLMTELQGTDGQSLNRQGNYMCAANRLVVGEWMNLRKGQRVDMEVLIGEIPGGFFGCRLLVEQQDAEYPVVPSDAGPRKVLPVFKTVPVDRKLVSQMKADPNEMTLDGPSFGALSGQK